MPGDKKRLKLPNDSTRNYLFLNAFFCFGIQAFISINLLLFFIDQRSGDANDEKIDWYMY